MIELRRASHFGVVERQNRIKNGQVMPIKSWDKNGVLAYSGPKISHFGHIYWNMDFIFLPIIAFDIIKGQTKLGVHWTQIDHFSIKNVRISKSHFAQVSITKKATPPTTFHEFVWNCQNRCYYQFHKY